MRYLLLYLIFFTFLSYPAYSQKADIDQLNKELRIAQKSDDLLSEIKADIGLGDYYCQIEKYSKSIRYYNRAIRINNNEQYFIQTITAYHKISAVEIKKNKLKDAQDALAKALNIAQKHNLTLLQDTLTKAKDQLSNTMLQATQAEQKYKQLKLLDKSAAIDSIMKESKQSDSANEAFLKKISQLSKEKQWSQIKLRLKQSELSKQELKIELLNQYNKSKELELWQNKNKLQTQNAIIAQKNIENEKQKMIISFSVGALILLIILIFYIIRTSLQRKKQNTLLEYKNNIISQKNKEISDSINYAKHIQDTILPSKLSISENLKDSFVLFKPKDIVSGDFYWLEKVGGVIYFAVADCTGHGVPGAMVSVICANALSKALLEEKITETGKILDRTREIVIQQFSHNEKNVKDGMDISLCKLTLPPSGVAGWGLQWSGANNPLWVIKKDTSTVSEMVEIKPNKQPIGKTINPQPFTTHKMTLDKGDSIYIFSDGYADQFGGEKGKKFKYKPMKELLFSLQNQDMIDQQESLSKAFTKWKGKEEQVDDVCVIGVKI